MTLREIDEVLRKLKPDHQAILRQLMKGESLTEVGSRYAVGTERMRQRFYQALCSIEPDDVQLEIARLAGSGVDARLVVRRARKQVEISRRIREASRKIREEVERSMEPWTQEEP